MAKKSLRLGGLERSSAGRDRHGEVVSAHPQMTNLSDISVILKIFSMEYQPYTCGKFFAGLDLDQLCLSLDEH